MIMSGERRRPARPPADEDGGQQLGWQELGSLTAVTRNVFPTFGVADQIDFDPQRGLPIAGRGGNDLGLRAEELSQRDVVILGVVVREGHQTMFLARHSEGVTGGVSQLLAPILRRPQEIESLTYAVIPGLAGSPTAQRVGKEVRDFFQPEEGELEDEERQPKATYEVDEILLEDITVLERGPELPQSEPMVMIKLMEQGEGVNEGRVMPTIKLVV